MLKLLSPAQLVLALLLCFTLAGESVATCSFINGAKKATLTISPANKTRLPSDTGFTSKSETLTASNLAALFGVSGSFVRLVSCTEGESLIIGNSSYAVYGNYLKANISGVYLDAQGQTTSVWKYPYNGGNYTMTLPSTGTFSAAFLTSGNENSGWYVIGHTYLSGKILQGGVVNGGLVLNISTSDGLDVMDVNIDSFTVTVPACTVNDYDKSVDLGTVYAQQMHSPGSTSSVKDFSINMTCASTSLSPTVTFSGEADSNYPTVLATSAGDATGVGVQLLYGGSAVTPGAAVSLGKVTSTSSRDYNFQARMYQTSSIVTAGSLEFTTVFTINYE